jgi:hypothetical protein
MGRELASGGAAREHKIHRFKSARPSWSPPERSVVEKIRRVRRFTQKPLMA